MKKTLKLAIKFAEKKAVRLSKKQDKLNAKYNDAVRALRSLYQQDARNKVGEVGDSDAIKADLMAEFAWKKFIPEDNDETKN